MDHALCSHKFVVELRHNQTDEEIQFFHTLQLCLKESFPDLLGHVGKQVPIRCGRSFYILDFYIGTIRLGFEIDGGYHFKDQQIGQDLKRDVELNRDKQIVVKHIPNSALSTRHSRKLLRPTLAEVIKHRRIVHRGIEIRRIALSHGWKKIEPEL